MERKTDRELLEAYFGTGSEEAFSELVRRHAGMVHRAAERILGDTHAAEDVSQAAFLLLVRRGRDLSRRETLAGWLLRSCRFLAADVLRERARRAAREEAVMKTAARRAERNPEATWEQLAPALDAALARLPRSEHDAVALRYLGGLSQEDAAREAGCDRGALSMRAARGLEKLRAILSRQGVTVPAAGLAAMLAANVAGAAPAALSASVLSVCQGQAASSLAAVKMMEGAMKAMFWMKLKLAAAVVGIVVAIGGGGGALAVRLAAAAGEPALTPSPLPAGEGPGVRAPAEPDPAKWPAWRKGLKPRTVTSVPGQGKTLMEVYKGAQWDRPPHEARQLWDLTSWGGGIYAPDLGTHGSMLISQNGHSSIQSAAIHRWDAETAQWTACFMPPNVNVSTGPGYQPPGGEIWYDPKNDNGYFSVNGHGFGHGVGIASADLATNELVSGNTDPQYRCWDGEPVEVTGAPPAPLAAGTIYYVVKTNGLRFQLAPKRGGEPIALKGQPGKDCQVRFRTDEPFNAGGWSIKRHPVKYGYEYNDNVTSAMRADGYAYIPAAFGGEAAGTLVFMGMACSHGFNGGASGHVWRVGLTNKAWLPRSLRSIPEVIPQGQQLPFGIYPITGFSEKYRVVFEVCTSYANMAIYDQKTNDLSWARTGEGGSYGILDSTAVITNGHSAHLFVAPGYAPYIRDPPPMGISVSDLDALMANGTAKGTLGWAVFDKDGKVPQHSSGRRLNLLTTAYGSGTTFAWSKSRQKLIVFRPNTENGKHITVGAPKPYTLHTVTIPSGNGPDGKPKWQTEPWVVEQIPLELGPGTDGLKVEGTGCVYKRFCWSDKLDCGLLVGGPNVPVQAITIW